MGLFDKTSDCGVVFKDINLRSKSEIKRIMKDVKKVLDLQDEYEAKSHTELLAKTDELKQRYQDGESLDSLLPEAFATVRAASWHVLKMRPYPVQVIGGIILHQGRIAEMRTGE
ncbi:MAG: preprotein translocase subunit SecA, partial [Clostridiales bacterium]|nr:preprotein translocase subunit SecA [Clostridiales bacterium]